MDSKAQAQLQQMTRALQGQLVPRTVTAAATLQLTDYLVACDATSAGFTLTLPAVTAARGMTFLVVKIDSSTNVVTIDGNASETINGATTQTLSAQWARAELYCDGVSWYDVAAPQSQAGTWTPTISGETNCTSVSVTASRYRKVGSLVLLTMYGTLSVTASATLTIFVFTLPFNQFTNAERSAGAGMLGTVVSVLQDNTDSNVTQGAFVCPLSSGTGTKDWFGSLTYMAA